METPVLKLIRSPDTRKIVLPRSNLLSSYGVYVIRPARSRCKVLYVWKGRYADTNSLKIACMLAEQMVGILTNADTIEVIDDVAEPVTFRDHIIQEGNGTTRNMQLDYDDLFKSSKASLDAVSRRHVICGMLKEKVPSQTTQSSQPILLVDSHDDYIFRSGTFSAHETESGEIRGEEYTADISPQTSTRRVQQSSPTITPRNSQKFSLVLKHNLQVTSSHTAVSVERPLLRNLTSTDIDEDDQKFSSRIDYNSRFLNGLPPLVRIGSITATSIAEGGGGGGRDSQQNNQNSTESVIHDPPTNTTRQTIEPFSPKSPMKAVKPMLYQCVPIEDYERSIDRKLWEWQRLKVYDDDDLVDVRTPSPSLPCSLPLILLISSSFPSDFAVISLASYSKTNSLDWKFMETSTWL